MVRSLVPDVSMVCDAGKYKLGLAWLGLSVAHIGQLGRRAVVMGHKSATWVESRVSRSGLVEIPVLNASSSRVQTREHASTLGRRTAFTW